MKYLKTYENIENVKSWSLSLVNFYETKNLKCQQHKQELDVIQIFTKPEGSQEHFGFIVFRKTGEMLFEIRGNQSSRTLTQEQINEIQILMDYFKVIRETEKYNI